MASASALSRGASLPAVSRLDSCASPADERAVRLVAGTPGIRPRPDGETLRAERGVEKSPWREQACGVGLRSRQRNNRGAEPPRSRRRQCPPVLVPDRVRRVLSAGQRARIPCRSLRWQRWPRRAGHASGSHGLYRLPGTIALPRIRVLTTRKIIGKLSAGSRTHGLKGE